MPKAVTELFDGILGKTHRIIAMYEDKCYPIFWFQVEKDGSIYCSVYKKADSITKGFTGSKVMHQGKLEFDFDTLEAEGEPVDFKKIPMKASFHSSGIINFSGKRVYRNSIRGLEGEEELFNVVFANPSSFEEITVARKYDMPIRMWLDADYPLLLHTSVAKSGYIKPHYFQSDRNDTVNLLIQYRGIEQVGDMDLQFSFGMPTQGRWPPYSIMFFPTVDKKT